MSRFVSLIAALVLVGCDRGPAVDVDGERLIGRFVGEGKVAAFLGVPFAEPPVGELRWRAPQTLQSKLKRRQTTEFAAACMQTMRILDWYRYMAETFGGSADYYPDLEVSEDCLYLNIWTATLDGNAGLPVMVWVHGGSNRSGWSYEPNYHGHVLAQKGVVVVSVAYRQGAFGFLSHPELSRDGALANFGLWDIVASLQWVRQNIRQFGGDPDRITVFGESAGAEDILALMFAEAARPLFDRAILQSSSGYGINKVSLAAEQARGVKLAQLLGLDASESLEQLRRVPADKLLHVYEEAFSEYFHSPAVDGQLITEATWEGIQAGRFADHELIMGTNADEWFDSIAIDATTADVVAAAEELQYLESSAALAAVAAEVDPRRALDRLTTAENYLCPTQSTAAAMTAAGGDAWLYYFTRVREDAGGQKVGAFHGAEYAYAFGVHDAYMLTNDVDLALTDTMMDYWVQFAATGNPNSEATPHWPQFRAPDFLVQELGNEVLTIRAPEPELCALFRARIAGRD
ncbi:MAG: carboxylesterase family protein [Gammaproteobacteria bacterium]|nr:carboxylesterase family protein [Gammaproteobacteria bacterium]